VQSWYLLAIISTLLNGIRAFTTKRVAEGQTPTVIARIVPGAVMVALGCVALLYRLTYFQSDLRQITIAAAIQGALFYIAALSRWEVLRLRTASHVVFPIVQVSTPLVVILSAVLFGEWKGLRVPSRMAGVVLAILATYALVDWRAARTGGRGRGVGFAFVAMLAGTGATLAAKAAFQEDTGSSVAAFIVISNAVGLAIGLIHTIVTERLQTRLITAAQLRDSIVIGVLNFLALAAFLEAIRTGDLTVVASIGALSAVIPIVLSVIFQKERLRARQQFAVLLSVAALLLLV